jgi:general stress protein YciG
MHRKNSKEKSDSISVREAGHRGGQITLQNRGVKHFKKIGRKGGQRTAQLYHELLSEFGKMGGRPRRPTLDETMGEKDQR